MVVVGVILIVSIISSAIDALQGVIAIIGTIILVILGIKVVIFMWDVFWSIIRHIIGFLF